MQRNILKTMYI